MTISAMHLVYLDSNQCKLRGKNPHHAQGQTQAESKSPAPNRRSNKIQCKACPAAALQSQQLQPGREGLSMAQGWKMPRESAERRIRASGTDLRDSVRVGLGCVGTASLLYKRAFSMH